MTPAEEPVELRREKFRQMLASENARMDREEQEERSKHRLGEPGLAEPPQQNPKTNVGAAAELASGVVTADQSSSAGEAKHQRVPAQAKAEARAACERWVDIDFDPKADDANWLVQGIMPAEGFGIWYGTQKNYKSFTVLDLGATIACVARQAWAGRKVKHGPVFYVCCEGQLGLRKRITALRQCFPELDDDLPFYMIKVSPDLGHLPGDRNKLIAMVRGQLDDDEQPALVIIDTLVRTLFGADENNEGGKNFADNCGIVARELACFVLAVHHTNASRARMRGSTALDGASDASISLERVSNDGGLHAKLVVEEAKDGESGLAFDVGLERYFFGDPEHDDCPSTLIVRSVEPISFDDKAEPAASKQPKMDKWQLALPVLDNTLNDYPEQPPNRRRYPTTVTLTKVTRLREALERAGLLDRKDEATSDDAYRQQWKRLKDDLIEHSALKIEGDYCWRPPVT